MNSIWFSEIKLILQIVVLKIRQRKYNGLWGVDLNQRVRKEVGIYVQVHSSNLYKQRELINYDFYIWTSGGRNKK